MKHFRVNSDESVNHNKQMSYHKHQMSLNNLNEIRILMVSIVGGSWNPVDVSSVFTHSKARIAVLTCVSMALCVSVCANYRFSSLSMKKTIPTATFTLQIFSYARPPLKPSQITN